MQLENLKLALELNEGKLGLEGMRRAIELRLVSQQQPLELIPALVDPVLPLCLRKKRGLVAAFVSDSVAGPTGRLMDQEKLYQLVKMPVLLWPLPFTTLVVLRKLQLLLQPRLPLLLVRAYLR